jgi:hypothetical protein
MNKQNICASNGDNQYQHSPKSDVWVDNDCEKVLRKNTKYIKSEAYGRSTMSRSIQVALTAFQRAPMSQCSIVPEGHNMVKFETSI